MKTMSGWINQVNARKLVGKKWFLSLAVMAVTLILLYFLASMVDVKAVAMKLLSIDITYIVYILLIEACVFVISAGRSRAILRYVGCEVPFFRCFSVNMASYPFLLIMPSVSGSLVKAVYLRDESSPGKVISSIITEKLFDIGVIGILAIAGLTYYFGYVVLLAAVLITILLIVLTRQQITGHRLEKGVLGKIGKILADISHILRDLRTTIILLSYSLVIWILALIQIFLFFVAIGADVPLLSVFLLMPIAMLAGQLPVTISGIGTRDGVMLYLFNGIISVEQILAVGFLFTVFRYWVPAMAGVLFVIAENRRALVSQKK